MFVVYGILNIDGSFFYIGKGKKQRLSSTLSAKNNNPLKKNKINQIRKTTGYNPKVKILCIGSEEYCFDIEKKLIRLFGKKIDGTGKLCNVSDGGEGTTGTILTSERKEQISKFFKENNPMNNPKSREKVRLSKLGANNPMYGKDFTKEHRNKIGIAHTGNKHWCFGKHRSEETKQKLREKLKGRIQPWTGEKQSEEHINKIREARCKRNFKIISPENNITETKFLNKFCMDNNLNSSHMYQVLKGNINSYKGWKVEEI